MVFFMNDNQDVHQNGCRLSSVCTCGHSKLGQIKKNMCAWVTGLKIFGRVGTHNFLIIPEILFYAF